MCVFWCLPPPGHHHVRWACLAKEFVPDPDQSRPRCIKYGTFPSHSNIYQDKFQNKCRVCTFLGYFFLVLVTFWTLPCVWPLPRPHWEARHFFFLLLSPNASNILECEIMACIDSWLHACSCDCGSCWCLLKMCWNLLTSALSLIDQYTSRLYNF